MIAAGDSFTWKKNTNAKFFGEVAGIHNYTWSRKASVVEGPITFHKRNWSGGGRNDEVAHLDTATKDTGAGPAAAAVSLRRRSLSSCR